MSEDYEAIQRQAKAREDADLARARTVPSHFANRAHLRTEGGLTRITFGEQVYQGHDPTAWTFAVTMTTENALAIADLIYQQAKYEEDRQAALNARYWQTEEEGLEPDPQSEDQSKNPNDG